MAYRRNSACDEYFDSIQDSTADETYLSAFDESWASVLDEDGGRGSEASIQDPKLIVEELICQEQKARDNDFQLAVRLEHLASLLRHEENECVCPPSPKPCPPSPCPPRPSPLCVCPPSPRPCPPSPCPPRSPPPPSSRSSPPKASTSTRSSRSKSPSPQRTQKDLLSPCSPPFQPAIRTPKPSMSSRSPVPSSRSPSKQASPGNLSRYQDLLCLVEKKLEEKYQSPQSQTPRCVCTPRGSPGSDYTPSPKMPTVKRAQWSKPNYQPIPGKPKMRGEMEPDYSRFGSSTDETYDILCECDGSDTSATGADVWEKRGLRLVCRDPSGVRLLKAVPVGTSDEPSSRGRTPRAPQRNRTPQYQPIPRRQPITNFQFKADPYELSCTNEWDPEMTGSYSEIMPRRHPETAPYLESYQSFSRRTPPAGTPKRNRGRAGRSPARMAAAIGRSYATPRGNYRYQNLEGVSPPSDYYGVQQVDDMCRW